MAEHPSPACVPDQMAICGSLTVATGCSGRWLIVILHVAKRGGGFISSRCLGSGRIVKAAGLASWHVGQGQGSPIEPPGIPPRHVADLSFAKKYTSTSPMWTKYTAESAMSSRAMASHLGCMVDPAGEFLKSWYPAHTLGQLKVSSCQCFSSPSSTSEVGSCSVGSAPQMRLCQEPPRAWPRNCMRWEWAVPGSAFDRLPGLLSLHIHRPPLRLPTEQPRRLLGARQHCRVEPTQTHPQGPRWERGSG